jgi:hypothetical protein
MKRIALLLTGLLLTSTLSADDLGFRFGLKASPNISWFRTETSLFENDGVGLGYSYGLVFDYYFTENYAISSGLNFVRTSATLKYPDIYDGSEVDMVRDYKYRFIELPLALKLSASEIGYLSYYGLFGLGLGFRTSALADERIFLPDGVFDPDEDADVADETKFFRAGLVLGAGMEYSFGGRTALLLGLTFHNGFSNILNMERKPLWRSTPSAHNLYLELTLGVMF